MTGPGLLSAHYAFLADEPGPPLMVEALKLYGVREYPGAADNPRIMGWRDELIDAYPGLSWVGDVYTGDAVPWCGLFMAYVAHRAGHGAPHPRFLAARSWAGWGDAPTGPPITDPPRLGDVLVFWRGDPNGSSGHVGIYVGEDNTHFHVLGGNQSDSVSITRIRRVRLLAWRRPPRVPNRPEGHTLTGVWIDPAAADATEDEA